MATAAQETGWNPATDEGARLMTTGTPLHGIQAQLTLPGSYDAPFVDSYFNFYVGINFPSGAAVEAGVSYGNRAGTRSWRKFINPGPSVQISTPASPLILTLRLNAQGIPECYVNSDAGLASSGGGAPGAVKMVMAIHEDHADTANRKVWFDQATFINLQLWDGSYQTVGRLTTAVWKPAGSLSGVGWAYDPNDPPSSHRLMQVAGPCGGSFTVTMRRPG